MLFTRALLAALILLVSGLAQPVRAESVLSIVFSGNSWGYLKPCPS